MGLLFQILGWGMVISLNDVIDYRIYMNKIFTVLTNMITIIYWVKSLNFLAQKCNLYSFVSKLHKYIRRAANVLQMFFNKLHRFIDWISNNDWVIIRKAVYSQ